MTLAIRRGQRLTLDAGLEVRAANDDGTFEGYGSVFGEVDSYNDIVARGAFVESLRDLESKGRKPALLWQHRPDMPIGVYEEVREDDKGLFVRGRLLRGVPEADKAIALLRGGAISGLSIGFRAREWSYDKDTDILTHTKVDLWEVSLVTFPACDPARVSSVKAMAEGWDSLADAEAALREHYSRREATAIVASIKSLARGDRAGGATERDQSAERDAQAAASLKASLARLAKSLS